MKEFFKKCLIVLLLAGFLAGCGSGGDLVADLVPNPNDDTPPTVLSTVPADNATDVANNRKIIATFDEAMNRDKMTDTGTFTLIGPGGPVAGAVTYSVINKIAIFTPSVPLAAGLHTATISTAARDVSGNELALPKIWSFTAGDFSDVTRPEVSLTSPADHETDVNSDTDINVIFTEVMDPATINMTTFTLETSGGPIPLSGLVTCTGMQATFNPSINLVPGIAYIARVTIEAADLAGNTLLFEKEWSFVVGN